MGTKTSGLGFWLGLLLLGITAVFAVRSMLPPEPLPIDASADAFSGLRAADTLAYLLGDETPHPVGSKANQAVRDRLRQALIELGLTPEVQRTVGCSARFSVCANVENVIAEIPGETSDALVLMAHYDSVPHAPGAADDGSGVATILETARALTLGGPYRNRILLVFTDAEEMGLLGAEAFFAEHRWVPDVRAVINLEGSGSGGPSMLLRSSNSAGHLLRAYQETASAAIAYSYSQEVFARMPNDTDFTVPDRAGIASIDFAFAYEFNHYHTPLDTLANLDKGTLQHHGDNALPLARRLADLDLNQREENFSYLTVEQTLWLSWPVGWTLGLNLLGLCGLLLVGIILRRSISSREIALAIGLAVASLISGGALFFAAFWLVDLINGTRVSFPANPWPWRVLIYTAAFLPAALACYWANGRISLWSRYLSAWFVLGLVALPIAITAPLAANLLVAPLLAAALLGCVGAVLSAPSRLMTSIAGLQSWSAMLISLTAIAPLAYVLLAIAYAMEETQGFGLAPVIFINLLLVAVVLLPLPASRMPALSLTVMLLLGWAGAALVPLYSEWRPQHLSFYYVLDRDSGEARLSTINDNPLPDAVLAAMTSAGDTAPTEEKIVPWSSQAAPGVRVPTASFPQMSVDVTRQGRRIQILIRSHGDGDFVQLILPVTADVTEFSMAGREQTLSERNGYLQARFFANGRESVKFDFTTGNEEPVEAYLVDGSHRLPTVVSAIANARGTLAVPRHQGDQRLIVQRIQF